MTLFRFLLFYYSAVLFIFVSVIASMVTAKSIAQIFSFLKTLGFQIQGKVQTFFRMLAEGALLERWL